MQILHHIFSATLTHQDMKQHIPYPVQVPPGTRTLRIRLYYAPHVVERVKNLLTLTILDPDGFRGAAHRHGNVLEVVIQENAASPGFFPRPIQPGEWTILVDTHMIMPGTPLSVELLVSGADQPDPSLLPLPEPPAAAPGDPTRGPGWYRGDLHTHTVHSDGTFDISTLLAFALANQLDFLTLSDHNTVSGLARFERECPPGLLPICGTELTTFWGHALALGRREWVDWRVAPGRREMTEIAAEVEAQGGLFIIAHPESISDPYCTGCGWRYAGMRPGVARVVEVWNDHWHSSSNNEANLLLAYAWLKDGLRMALTAGSDRHGKAQPAPEIAFNQVYAEELSEQAVLRAVRAGRVVLSCGPGLSLTARMAGQDLMPGDSCRVPDGDPIQLSAEWGSCPPGVRLALVVDGETRHELHSSETSGSAAWQLAGGQAGWAHLTLRDADGEMLALTNPIFFDGR